MRTDPSSLTMDLVLLQSKGSRSFSKSALNRRIPQSNSEKRSLFLPLNSVARGQPELLPSDDAGCNFVVSATASVCNRCLAVGGQ